MKTVLKGLTTAVIIAAAVTTQASAQQKTWGFGGHGAYFKSGTLAMSSTTNTRLQLDNERTAGGNIELWPGGGRIGLRANVDWTHGPMVLENHDNPGSPGIPGDLATLDAMGKDGNHFDIWMGDADLMIRLLSPTVDRKFAPFISLGGGVVKWDQQTGGAPPINLHLTEVDAQIQGQHQSEPALTGSFGSDFFVTHNVALRLEAKDYYNWSSPYIRLTQINAADSRHHAGTNNFVYSAGLSFLFGGHKVAEPGFIAEAPAPAPPPPPAPAPAPRVTTEQVAMCTVNNNGELQMVAATRNLDTREITVMRNGSSVAFTTAYPASSPYYVQNADWYVASRPLIINLTPMKDRGADVDVTLPANRIELVNFGSTGPLMTTNVVYVGSVNGTPLYAKRTDISADLLPDLQTRLRTQSDLNVVLADQAFADRFSSGISTFYIPVAPSEKDCVFQPVSSTRVVRRTRG